MPTYDVRCDVCQRIERDVLEPIHAPQRPCETAFVLDYEGYLIPYDIGCPGTLQRVWLPGHANAVKGDEIDVWVRNGLCWPDGSPRHFTSQAHLDRVAAKQDMTNYVVHQPTKEGDRSPHTVRWDCISPVSEKDRLKRWYEHEAELLGK